MRNTNGLNRSGRKRGATNIRTRLELNAMVDIITNDEYCSIIRSVVDVALNGKEDSDRLRAAKIIIERVEGKIPDAREIEDTTGTLTVADLLASLDKPSLDEEEQERQKFLAILESGRIDKGELHETSS